MDRFSTQRTIITTRSASKPRRRGLSLTSKSQSSSLQKKFNTSFVSIGQNQYIIHPQIVHKPNFQSSRPQDKKLVHNQKIFVQSSIFDQNNKKKYQTNSQNSYAIKRQSIKPKVTFNYSNTTLQTHYRQNYFVSAVRPSVLEYEKRYSNNFTPFQNKVNNYNPVNTIPINYALNYNPKAQNQLIRYSHTSFNSNSQFKRQITNKQSVYQVQIGALNQISLQSKQKQKNCQIRDAVKQSQSFNTSQIYPTLQLTNKDYIHPQDSDKNQLGQQKYRSPYHMLISTAKKCQSKQVSPSKLRENQNKIAQLGIMSLQQIPQVNQFTIKEKNTHQTINQQQYFDGESLQSVDIQIKNILKVKNQNFTSLKQVSKSQLSKVSCIKSSQKSIPYVPTQRVIKSSGIHKIIQQQKVRQLSSQKKSSSNIKTKQQIKAILRNKRTSKTSLVKQNIQHRLQKSQKRISLNSIQQIQNKKPVESEINNLKNHKLSNIRTNQKNTTTNSKRNSRRIRQIEKRLQQIITICDKNL